MNRYFCTVENLRETLERFGVAIIPNVLSADECARMLDGMWNYFEHISREWPVSITRGNSASWKNIYTLLPLHSMLYQYWNCGHSQVCWDIRQNPRVAGIFAQLWNCDVNDLLVSFDGLSFAPPPETTGRGWHHKTYITDENGNRKLRYAQWYHTDQSYTRNGFECIQSWVTALDVNEGDATLGFLEGSHLLHGEFAQHNGITAKGNWYKLSDDEIQFYLGRGCSPGRISCPAGSMVFWDSRTIHCGVEPVKGRAQPNFRAVVYVCYQPRAFADDREIKKKNDALENLRTTSHWPCEVKMFPKNPRSYGQPLPTITQIPPPQLTPLGRRLAGFHN